MAESKIEKTLGRVGVVGRFRPLHIGASTMLECICEQAEEVIIGIGSSNKYNLRNPFTVEETREMINLYLEPRFSNYSFLEVPDFAHLPEYADGKRWTEYMLEHYGKLDNFVNGNSYVKQLLQPHYDVIHPATLIPPEKHIWVKGAIVRMEMAKSGNWKALVPEVVGEYLEKNGLVERFKREFGLQALAQLYSGDDYRAHESAGKEKEHTTET